MQDNSLNDTSINILEDFTRDVELLNLKILVSERGFADSDFYIKFASLNAHLEGTEYFAENTGNLLHFTSIPALESILKEKTFRLYNLHKSDDDLEYKYAGELMSKVYKTTGWQDDDITIIENITKENLFYLSLTDISNITSLYHWNKYGRSGQGVAIEFEIMNDISWKNVLLSTIKYDQNNDFEKLIDILIRLHEKYRFCSFNLNLEPFFGLHKHPDFHLEKEIRLLINYKDGEEFRSYFGDKIITENGNLSRKNKIIKYFKLPLTNHNQLSSNDFPEFPIPKIVIKKVHFSDKQKLNQQEYKDLKNRIIQLVSDGLGFKIEIGERIKIE